MHPRLRRWGWAPDFRPRMRGELRFRRTHVLVLRGTLSPFSRQNTAMPTILRLLLSLGLFAVGLVLAAGMLVASLMLLAFWSVRALCLKLAGRRAPPFTARFSPREAFRGTRRRASAGDVIDVEARPLP